MVRLSTYSEALLNGNTSRKCEAVYRHSYTLTSSKFTLLDTTRLSEARGANPLLLPHPNSNSRKRYRTQDEEERDMAAFRRVRIKIGIQIEASRTRTIGSFYAVNKSPSWNRDSKANSGIEIIDEDAGDDDREKWLERFRDSARRRASGIRKDSDMYPYE